tara:strand:- start:636 stop:755 length:120 start_codon:yes stop_codon:yes gene_type:complete
MISLIKTPTPELYIEDKKKMKVFFLRLGDFNFYYWRRKK